MNSPKLSREEFDAFRTLIYGVSGISFPDNKLYFLETKLMPRLRARQISNYRDYYRLVTTSPYGREEIQKLLALITTHETSFFRETPQFDALRCDIFPQLIREKQAGLKQLRIWSAACSSGEEPYTIAMLVNEHPTLSRPPWRVDIVGTDLSETILAYARKGAYTQYALRNTPPAYRLKYFAPHNDTYHIKAKVRGMVQFSQLNLSDPLKMRSMRRFDLVFCRNTLIYFNLESKTKVINSLYESLLPGGYLLLSMTESMFEIRSKFNPVRFPCGVLYQKPLH